MNLQRLKMILDNSEMESVPELETDNIHEQFVIKNRMEDVQIIGDMTISFQLEEETITEDFGLGVQTMVIGQKHKNIYVQIDDVEMWMDYIEIVMDFKLARLLDRHIREFIKNQIS